MSQQRPCPDPPGCRWESRTLRGAPVQVCGLCGRVQLDAQTLEELTGGPPQLDPLPEAKLTPGAPPRRAPALTPGAPPARPPRSEPEPPPSQAPGRLPRPPLFERDAAEFSAAPPPESIADAGYLGHEAIDPRPEPSVDDSRYPTEEAPIPNTPGISPSRQHRGPRSDSDPGEPVPHLGRAITRSDEPELGLSVDDTNLPHEGQSFLSPQQRTARVSLDADPELDPDALDWRPQRRLLPRLLAILALVLIVVVVVGSSVAIALPGLLRASPSSPPTAPAAPAPAAPEPEPAPLTAGEPETSPGAASNTPDTPERAAASGTSEPTTAPTPPADRAPAEPAPTEPTPTAEPKPGPGPPPKPRVSVYKASIDAGWSSVEANPDKAADAFRAALDARPGDSEASYGLGYAMLKLGQRNGARAYLCAATQGADTRTSNEIRAVLSNAELSCE